MGLSCNRLPQLSTCTKACLAWDEDCIETPITYSATNVPSFGIKRYRQVGQPGPGSGVEGRGVAVELERLLGFRCGFFTLGRTSEFRSGWFLGRSADDLFRLKLRLQLPQHLP